MSQYPRAAVWLGITIQILCFANETWPWLHYLVPLPMALCGWGLYHLHTSKGHPHRYVLYAAASAIVPLVGPVLGLMLRPPQPGGPSSATSYSSWGFFLIGVAVLWAICPAREAQGFALGSLMAAALSFAAWALHRAGNPGVALGIFISSFAACAAGVGLGLVNNPSLLRKSVEGATKADLSSIRSALNVYYGDAQGAYPPALETLTEGQKYLRTIPPAKTPGYHPDSSAVASGKTPDDAGGWLYSGDSKYDPHGAVWVNCTHTDSKGTAWNSY